MTQSPRLPIAQPSRLQKFLLLQKVSWLSSLGILSGGLAFAQTPAEITLPETPNAAEVMPSADLSQPEAVNRAVPSPAQPEMSAPERSPDANATLPDPVFAPILNSGSPSIALPAAADAYTEPAAVVLSERSSGCQSTVQFGQGVAYGACGAPAPPAEPVASGASGTIATVVSSVATTVQSTFTNQPASPSFSSASLSSVAIGTTASVQDFYKRTVRPPSALGNGNIKLIFPLSIPAAISSAFGWRIHPISGDQRLHAGTDLAAPLGTPVLAAFAGQVALADFFGGYGLAVALDHNKSTQQTLYAHLSEIFVKPGEWVKQGEVIGRVGSTGNSTGPHLHFEFRQLTPDGWVAMDAGLQLEFALAQLMQALARSAQANGQAKPG